MTQWSFRSVDHFFYVHAKYRLYSMSGGDALHHHKRETHRDKRCRQEYHCKIRDLFHLRKVSYG
jgi:hypothetical protein